MFNTYYISKQIAYVRTEGENLGKCIRTAYRRERVKDWYIFVYVFYGWPLMKRNFWLILKYYSIKLISLPRKVHVSVLILFNKTLVYDIFVPFIFNKNVSKNIFYKNTNLMLYKTSLL